MTRVKRAAEAGQMRAAVALRDVVGEAQHVLVIAVVPPQGAFDGDAVALALDHDRIGDQRLLGAVEIAHEGLDAAFIEELDVLGLDAAPVGEHDAHAGIEEGQFAQAMLDRREVEFGLGEDFGRGRKVTSVPRLSWPSRTTASGASATPLVKLIACSLPSRQMRNLSEIDSALTTETPTPCRPPETL